MDDRRMLGNHISKKDISVLTYSRDALSAPLRRLQYVVRMVREKTFDPDKTRSGMWDRSTPGGSSGSQEEPCLRREIDEAGFMIPKPKAMMQKPNQEDFAMVAERELQKLANDQKVLNKQVVERLGISAFPDQEQDEEEDDLRKEVSASDEESTDEDKAERLVRGRCSESKHLRGPAVLADETMVWRHVKFGTFHLGKLASPDVLACGRSTIERYAAVQFGEEVTLPRCRVCFGSSNEQ